ncbi:MAG: hypothetical protein KBT04_05895 [Bacteroidales bacterium]|nr:hypothetical protein [Candidatus Colimorpha onthohippi]
MKRAYSVSNMDTATFRVMELDGVWQEALGQPELSGSWMIYGMPKNGKTSMAMCLCAYLASKGYRVAYNSVEEGLSLSLQAAVRRYFGSTARNFVVIDKESVEEMRERLSRRNSAQVVVVDSVQFLGLTFSEYKSLKEQFPHKLFIYISHVSGQQPDGKVACKIWRDCNVYMRVEGFRGFPVGRYGGGATIDADPVRAQEYWGNR